MDIFEITNDSSYYDKAVILRYELFFRDFELPIEVTCDEHEPESRHFVSSSEGKLFAYARLTHVGENVYRISQVVVRPKHQRKGYGKAILNYVIQAARESGAESIYLNSQTSARKLYEGLGFRAVGEIYQVKLTGVPHIKMAMTL